MAAAGATAARTRGAAAAAAKQDRRRVDLPERPAVAVARASSDLGLPGGIHFFLLFQNHSSGKHADVIRPPLLSSISGGHLRPPLETVFSSGVCAVVAGVPVTAARFGPPLRGSIVVVAGLRPRCVREVGRGEKGKDWAKPN